MSLLAELEDISACAAWSPLKEYGDYVVTGTKDSKDAGFEDTGGELRIWRWRRRSQRVEAVGRGISTAARFASIAWTPYDDDGRAPHAGCVVGGMLDGSLVVWDAAALMTMEDGGDDDTNDHAVLIRLPAGDDNHGPVSCLAWNPTEPRYVAAGTSHGQAYVVDLADAIATTTTTASASLWRPASRHATEVTAAAWNPQVSHICATASASDVIVWDVKAGRPWCELRTPSSSTSDLRWNPRRGLHLLTADGPVIHVWDLAASTTLPVAQLAVQGGATVLTMDWCPHDETLLVTSAKDGKAYVWDLRSMTPLAELPNVGTTTTTAQQHQQQQSNNNGQNNNPAALFAASSTPSHVRYEVHWSPHHRGVLLTCRLDRHVQWQALPALPRPTAWQTPPSCRVGQGFGGTLATVVVHNDDDDDTSGRRTVKLSVVSHNPRLVAAATATAAVGGATTGPRDACLRQQAQASPREAAMWGFLSVLFENNARQALLEYLGFSALEIRQDIADLEEVREHTTTTTETVPDGEAVDELVQNALTVGDFAAAVDACFHVHNYADALLLASCGGAELWTSTQERYLAVNARPYVATVRAVLQAHSSWMDLVESSDLTHWQRTLALCATYGTSQEFPRLCQTLGKRIQDAGDHATASLCFICAMDFEAVVSYWKRCLGDVSQVDDWRTLHDFCTKVSILQQACSQPNLPDDAAQLFTQYAQLLANEGLLVAAAAYAKDGVLQDRLYRSRASPACLAAMKNQPPAFPFQMQQVDACRGVVNMDEQRQAAEQARIAAEQQAAYQKQQAEYQRQQREAQQAAQAEQRAQQQQKQAAYQNNDNNNSQQPQYANGYQGHGTQAPAASDELPAGWMELHDPNSGRPYYYNQTTQETTWERPAPAPMPAPVPATPQPDPTTPGTKKRTLASKYGDGFVSSASDPKLAYQYGNVGTSNPYHGSERPGPAAGSAGAQQAPISDTFNVDHIELSTDLAPLRDSLVQMVESLKSLALGAADKRQMMDGEKAVAVFVKKLARQAIHEESLENAKTMVSSLVARDFRTATAMQTALVNSDWREHKDWLKGFKSLIQLASRKLAHPHPIQY